jgi:hypothetical protein
MRIIFITSIFIVSMFTFSCKNEIKTEPIKQTSIPDSLITVNRQLYKSILEKDSLLTSFIESYSEIQQNLSIIRSTQQLVNSKSSVANRKANKQLILENIKTIEGLMEKNQSTILQLKEKMKVSDAKNESVYNSLISTLEKINEEKEKEMPVLMSNLDSIDIQIKLLGQKYNDAAAEAANNSKLLNAAFYTAGTEKELLKKGVITQQGGFIGLGKTQKLSERFNKDNFSRVDISKLKTIKLSANKIKLITTHPQSTYKITKEEDQCIITISNSQEFWAASKYMVVLIEK